MAIAAKTTAPLPASSRTVVVACKVPNGLRLQLQKETKVREPKADRSGYEVAVYMTPTGKPIFVNGPAYPVGSLPEGFPRIPEIEGGYALTFGVPREFWDTWLEQNKLASYVESNMIFACASREDAQTKGREMEKLLSGLEPMSTAVDTDGRLTDPRAPKPLNSMLSKVGTERHPNG